MSLGARAADFRDHDIVRLTDLIKAGIFSSPRMEGSFDLRMRMSQDVPGDIESLRNGESEPRAYTAQWMRAMPLLASAVRQIADSERVTPFHINDIDCERLWTEDMEAIPIVDLPDRTSRAAESTVDHLPAPATDPTTSALGLLGSAEAEEESNGGTDTEPHRRQLGLNITVTESDFPRLAQAVEGTTVAADGLIPSLEPF